jgi:hypothetical protein
MARVSIHLADLGDMPPVCVCCGKPATRVRKQEFRLDGLLSATVTAASALAGGLAWTDRGVSLHLPVCEYHRKQGRKSNRTFFNGMAVTAVLGVAAYAASFFGGQASGFIAVVAMFAFMATLVAAMHEVDDGLKVKSLTRDTLTLTGVSRAFAEAVRGEVVTAGRGA